jgi:hypothetical protein
VLTLLDFSHIYATKRLMRMGSACEGPSVARCLPCATAYHGSAVGSLTMAAAAIDDVVCKRPLLASRREVR